MSKVSGIVQEMPFSSDWVELPNQSSDVGKNTQCSLHAAGSVKHANEAIIYGVQLKRAHDLSYLICYE